MPYIPMLIFALCIVDTVLWFDVSLWDIFHRWADLERADKQLAMYSSFHSKAWDNRYKAGLRAAENSVHSMKSETLLRHGAKARLNTK